jgi:RecB family exonuclease
VNSHVETLVEQLAHIVADGVADGSFTADDPRVGACAAFDAASRFHNPAHAPEWTDPQTDAAYEAVRSLVLRGLTAPHAFAGRRRPCEHLCGRLLRLPRGPMRAVAMQRSMTP